MIKKVLKYLLILTAGVFLLVILSLLFTQTAMFRNIVKNKFTEFATSQWNIQIEIDQIDGNFYSNLELVGVSVANNNKALISFSSLKLDYNILELRDRRIVADSVLLKNPSFNIWQNTDSTWNFIELFRNKEKDTLKNRKPFKFAVHANYVAIKNGNIAVSSFIDLIPTSVTGLNIEVDGVYSTENIVVNLRRLIFKTEKPTLNIKEFRTLFTMENKMLGVENLVLRTSGSNIFIDANFHGLNNLDAEIEVNPIDKQELSIFLPSLKLVCSPEIKTQIQIKNDTTIAQIELQNGEQSVLVDAKFHSLKKAMEDKNAKVPYFATVTLKNIAPEKWVEMKKTESIINGKINLSSSNLLNYKLPINVNANLQNSVYNGRLFSKLLVNGIYTNNNIETEIELQTESGGAFINGKIANITSVPVYDISIITNDLNLTSFFPEINSTVLNGQIEAKGEGFTNSTRNIEAIILLENSTVYKIPVNSAEIKVRMNNQEIFIDSLKMLMPGGAASALGEFDLTSKYLSSDIHVDADSLSFLSKFISLPVNFTSLTTDANIQGATNNLVVSGDALINNAEGYSLKSDKLVTTYSVSLKKDSLRVKAKLKANTLVTEPIVWDTINAELDFFDNTIIADINALWNDTLEANIKTKIWLGDTLLIELPMFNAKSFFSHYYLADTLQSVQIHKNSVNINNLWVKDYNQPEFNLKMQGDLSFKQSENIQLSIEHLDLKPFNSFIELEDSISGELFSNFSVTGSAHNPTVEGTIDIENPGFGSLSIEKFSSQLNYIDQKSEIVFSLIDSASRIDGSFKAELEAHFDTTGFVYKPPELFDAEVKVDSLKLNQQVISESSTIELAGVINMDLKANGSFKNPQLFGFLSFSEGYFSDSEFGLKYNDINFLAQFDGKKINLDTFIVKQDKGFLTITGEIEFDSTMIKGDIKSSSLVADASSFFIAQNRNYEIQIDANTFVRKGENNPEFGGVIKVIQSDFNIPAILSKGKDDSDDMNKPLLLQALASSTDSVIGTMEVVDNKLQEEKNESLFFKELTGRIKLDIPRNTWLRSDDMNLELRGEVDVVKRGPFLEIFGNIEINRGHYILYGRKLQINKGEIIFQGGENIDPMLNFNATYTFRDSKKEKRELELIVTGLLSDPTIDFLLDEKTVTESEAASILIFGRTSDETGYSNANGLVNSMGSSMVASVVSAQLSKTLGSRFNLDMIEVTATENWQSAAFVVGKYIGNDLFVTYQRGFGETDGDEITPETITLEYELNRLLFLRLQSGSSKTSGFDVILKFEQKMKD